MEKMIFTDSIAFIGKNDRKVLVDYNERGLLISASGEGMETCEVCLSDKTLSAILAIYVQKKQGDTSSDIVNWMNKNKKYRTVVSIELDTEEQTYVYEGKKQWL